MTQQAPPPDRPVVSPRFDLSAPVPAAADLGATHFLGIGGIGMSGIARLLTLRGVPVSGSDAKDSPIMASLRALGARAQVGFDVARLEGVSTVVASSAIRPDNVELAAAHRRGLRVLHRSQALQSLMVGRVSAAVAGTNGKTTTSSMLTVLLREAGLDPSFAIGGELVGAETNADEGAGEVFVAEADESDASFLVYTPAVSVVTNVQPDHLDFYGTPAAVVAGFEAFSDRLVADGRTGVLVACADDPGSAALAARARGLGRRVVTYGESAGSDVLVRDVQLGAGVTFSLLDSALARTGARTVRLVVPGRHNALNAAAAYAAGVLLGADPNAAVAGLQAFAGARRRFEFRGEIAGVRVYDDYAHNPAKVSAAIATGRQAAAGSRLIVAFQPHLYSRTRDFADAFAAALGGADEVVVLDVYGAREDPLPGVSGELVSRAVPLPAEQVRFSADRSAVPALLADLARRGDVVLTIGAGDITALASIVLEKLAERPELAERQQSPREEAH